jgi:hypothetical protein
MTITSQQEKKHDLAAVKPWLTTMAERGIIPENSARLRATAIKELTSILGTDEPNDAVSVLANLDELTRRWATLNTANPATASTYKQRARRGLEDFLAFQIDPTGFRPKVVKLVPDGARAPRKAKEPTEITSKAKPSEAKQEVPADRPQERSYPLPSGEFFYRLPPNGISINDVQRLAWHLATMATDFDPMVQSQRNPLARRDE